MYLKNVQNICLACKDSVYISTKSREKLIHENYSKTKNIYFISDSVINAEIKKCKQEYFKENTLTADISEYIEYRNIGLKLTIF